MGDYIHLDILNCPRIAMPRGIINDMELFVCVKKYFSMSIGSIKKYTCQCGKNIVRIFLLDHVHEITILALKVDNI
jgi:hypothetical protein